MSNNLKPGPEPVKKGMSGVVMVLAGCGAVVLFGVLACAGLVGLGVWYGVSSANEFASEFEKKGYEKVSGQQVTETDPIESKRIYMAQHLVVKNGSDEDLAIACQVAEISGTVIGDIDFFGQVLEIKKDAVVKGNIRVRGGQVITILGVVEGDISGSYQVLDDKRQQPSPP